jgi:hypothetical protein
LEGTDGASFPCRRGDKRLNPEEVLLRSRCSRLGDYPLSPLTRQQRRDFSFPNRRPAEGRTAFAHRGGE